MQNISPLREQTIMNNYVFSMVMREPKRIKPLLEYILGKKIHAIKVLEAEKVLKEKYESKGVRLDPNPKVCGLICMLKTRKA